MTRNHVGNLYARNASNSTAAANENRIGRGFGFNFELTMDLGEANRMGSPGDYGWYGAYFPRFWVDPAERLVAVFMAQLTPNGGSDLHDKFRTLVYQSIVRSDYDATTQSDASAAPRATARR
jgi:CubicO group peptidase (beta-lactamase class C family)